jgi:hypothetical protein
MPITAEELLRSMRAALEEERDGIRRLDSEAVTRANGAKEKILAQMRNAPPSERAALVSALRELKGELRRNLVLLAHARDYLRDAVALCTSPGKRPRLEAKL